jgi:ornithine cyclodeaminase
MLSFDALAVRRALPFPALIGALRDAFAAGCEVPPRQILEVGTEAAPVTMLVMPAFTRGRHAGVKIVNVAPGNAALGLPALSATYTLFDARTGVPLAAIDGGELTARRTAAASALAASCLARPESHTLLVAGAGRVGSLLPLAHAAVRPIRHVWVWSRQPAHAQALARELAAHGLDAAPVDDLAAAARRADIVSCATLATAPLIEGAWLRPGTHLDLVGGFTPAMRECDAACLQQASVWVDTEEALHKAGELLQAAHEGWALSSVRGDLAALCRGEQRGRERAEQRTVFKSVGTALEDLAAAVQVLRSAPS